MKSYTQLEQIINEVLSKIKPTKEDEEKVLEKVNEVISRLKDFDVQIHGSFRKGTWLKGDADVDVFIFFPKNTGKEYLEKDALKILRERLSDFDITIAYAEHPYLIVNNKGIEIDVVPGLKVESGDKAITAVDRTPFHTEFISSHLTESQKDDVRILKRFMKGIGVYGAEIKTQGFSGYVNELLIVKYGSFVNVIQNAKHWRVPVLIDIVEPQKKFDAPVIIPDPVDPKRNAAAAVSLSSLAKFVIACNYFSKNPSISFFYPPESPSDIIKGDILITKIRVEERAVEDLLWGQIYKNIDKIRNELRIAGFNVIDIKAYGNSETVTIAIQLESRKIGKYYVNHGPLFYMTSAVENFIKDNTNVWIGEDGRLYSIKERKETNPEEIVKNSLSLKYTYKLEQYWLEKEPSEPCLKEFLRKTPSWLI
jgi:tRNA nucleotidyltransferase (CCA-adding enzyme)